MEHNIDYVAKCPIPIGIGIGIIILGMFLKLYVALCRRFIQVLTRHPDLLAEFLFAFFLISTTADQKPSSCCDACNCRSNNGRKPAAMKPPLRSSSSFEEETLSRREVEMVMERLGFVVSRNYDNNNKLLEEDDKLVFLGAQDIARVFEEQEPSFDEVKDAFNVFDTNGDGLIDAAELRRVLRALGVEGVSERECRRVMMAFNDGVIDLKDFTKLVEKSLS